MVVSYISKSEVSTFTDLDESDINDFEVMMANSWVESLLDSYRYTPSKYATNEYLKMAALLICCEILSQKGKINLIVGDITEERIGRIMIRRSRNPMFFFSRGSALEALDMYALIPHETYRQWAYQFVVRFIRANKPDRDIKLLSIDYDSTDRGYGWNSTSDSS